MKKSFLFLLILTISYSYAQSVNEYKAIIVPVKYEFLKGENQYRLNTITKFNLNKAGFVSFYNNETIPSEYSDRCDLLYADVVNDSGFLTTKLYLTLKDCYGKIIFQSLEGKSKEKDFKVAYNEALTEAFESVYELQYKYSGVRAKVQPAVVAAAATPVIMEKAVAIELKSDLTSNEGSVLYAQATETGFQLIDNTPKVIMKLFKTSQANSFIAIRDAVQGSLILKDNQWYFEYYQNDKLISEKVAVKF
ncbi:hypothetical protein [Flavobacterium sandaracinum]|uniref:Uncharacterized protein n=1 Tax=Flavobacterium sandaracinum TaxID=2541733 RepID=A0A4R5CK03_9FLAO|nr:hypothetical protein [Flavobacterium sandaracinum]TDE00186.1 hypothetical protein E0F91_16955 [Flavobacterium sandaracinum]